MFIFYNIEILKVIYEYKIYIGNRVFFSNFSSQIPFVRAIQV